jgi:hypothetical protein
MSYILSSKIFFSHQYFLVSETCLLSTNMIFAMPAFALSTHYIMLETVIIKFGAHKVICQFCMLSKEISDLDHMVHLHFQVRHSKSVLDIIFEVIRY